MWNVREQITMAAIDLSMWPLAQLMLTALKRQFGVNSKRVNKLEAQFLEAQGMYQEAEDLYGEILRKDITNIGVMKRLVRDSLTMILPKLRIVFKGSSFHFLGCDQKSTTGLVIFCHIH